MVRDESSQLSIVIQDDGIGFEPADLDDQRFGLRGMQERAEQIGARLRVDSKVGQGTKVTVSGEPLICCSTPDRSGTPCCAEHRAHR